MMFLRGLFTLCLVLGWVPGTAFAHCDTLDGPVVQDAKRAIDQADVTPVLKWVGAGDEDEVRRVFEMTVAARAEGPTAQQLADRYFFETLVRLHRAGEGAPFTGLKPAGHVEPAIAAADRALAQGSVDQLADRIAAAVRQGVVARFETAHAARARADVSVEEGREYVHAYVGFTHYVEAAHELAEHGAEHGHAAAVE